jgi:outer membrane lipoprotein carrier protein
MMPAVNLRAALLPALLALSLAVPLARAADEASSMAAPAAPTALDRYLAGLKGLHAGFTQQAVDASGKVVESGSGELLVSRPGRFRWQYQPAEGGPQLLVADGRNLWFYDRDLQQATVKPASAGLGTTPIMLLSATPADLHRAFELRTLPARDGADWVAVTPRDASADFASAELGFRAGQLAGLVIHDRLGQVVTLQFTRSERNARIPDAELRFSPPAGVDLIGTPRK